MHFINQRISLLNTYKSVNNSKIFYSANSPSLLAFVAIKYLPFWMGSIYLCGISRICE